MAKFRSINIRSGSVISQHLSEGITVNGITLSGSQASQRSFSLNNKIGLIGTNVNYDLDSFLSKFGGVVSGATTVLSVTTASGSVVVPSGSTLTINTALSGADLLQAVSGISGSSVTVSKLITLTDSSVLSDASIHEHTVSALGGKEERQLAKIAASGTDTISLDFGDFSVMNVPNSASLSASDVEAYLNGQLLEYNSSSGYSFDSTNGLVTFNPAISGDHLMVVWRSPDPTAENYEPQYEVNRYPYLNGENIVYSNSLYTVGGPVSDTLGNWSSSNPDGLPDLHFRLALLEKKVLRQIDLYDENGIFASTASGAGLNKIHVYTGRIKRTLPFTMYGYGSFVFDIYASPSAALANGSGWVEARYLWGSTLYDTNSAITNRTGLDSGPSYSNLGNNIDAIYSWYVPKRVFTNQTIKRSQRYTDNQGVERTRIVSGSFPFDFNYISNDNTLPYASSSDYQNKTFYRYPRLPNGQQPDYFESYTTGIPADIRTSPTWSKFTITANGVLPTYATHLSLSIVTTGVYVTGGPTRTVTFSTKNVNYPIVTLAHDPSTGEDFIHFDPQTQTLKLTKTFFGFTTEEGIIDIKVDDAAAFQRMTHLRQFGKLDVYVPTTVSRVANTISVDANGNNYISSYSGRPLTSSITATGSVLFSFRANVYTAEQTDTYYGATIYSLGVSNRSVAGNLSYPYSNLEEVHYMDPGLTEDDGVNNDLLEADEFSFDNLPEGSSINSYYSIAKASVMKLNGFQEVSFSGSFSQTLPKLVMSAQSISYGSVAGVTIYGSTQADEISFEITQATQL